VSIDEIDFVGSDIDRQSVNDRRGMSRVLHHVERRQGRQILKSRYYGQRY
jgi:hypothetical protein